MQKPHVEDVQNYMKPLNLHNKIMRTHISILPNELLEQIFTYMIKNKRYADLNTCKKIPLLSKVIFALKRHYMLHLYNRMSKCVYISHKQEVKRSKLEKFTPMFIHDGDDDAISEYYKSEYHKTKLLDVLVAPQELLEINPHSVEMQTDTAKIKHNYIIKTTCCILSKFIIIGKNIRTVIISIGECIIFKYYYLNASIISIKTLSEGILDFLTVLSPITIEVYGNVQHLYVQKLFIKNIPYRFVLDMHYSTDYYTNYTQRYRKNRLRYYHGMCAPIYSN